MKKSVKQSVFWLVLILIVIAIVGACTRPRKLISPIPEGYMPEKLMVVYAKEESDPEIYIRQVFQEDAEKALRVARCESKMNPFAIGDNNTSYGLFQINLRWHKIAPKFLLNYRINILTAKQLFDESGKSFKLWACQP